MKIARKLAFLILYVLAGHLSLKLASTGGGYAAPVWPPTGIAVAWLAVCGVGCAPGVWLGAFAVNFWISGSHSLADFALSALIGFGNAAEALTIVLLLRRVFSFSERFERIRDVTAFAVSSVAGATASASIGSLSLLAFGKISSSMFVANGATWWLGDLIGAFVVAPLLMSLFWKDSALSRHRMSVRRATYPALLLVMSALAFGGMVPRNLAPLFVAFVAYSALIWCALTLSTRALVTAMAAVSALAVAATYNGHGLFGSVEGIVHRLFLLQFFVGCASITMLTLSAAVSESLRREAALVSAEKMSLLGEMTSGIAHEINNPLAVIHGKAGQLAQLASEGPLPATTVVRAAEKIEAMAGRIQRTVNSIKFFSRDAAADPFQSVSVKGIIDDTLELCADRFRQSSVELIVDPMPESAMLECRAVQIAQVLLNLLNNAHDAVTAAPGAKRVRLTTVCSAQSVEISVIDSGTGVAPEIRPQIFRAFFTTKKPGEGTGLGLSISRAIVEKHQGTLELDVTAAETRFVMRLPRRQRS